MSRFPKPIRVKNIATTDCTLRVHEIDRAPDGKVRVGSLRKLTPGQAAILFVPTCGWVSVVRDGPFADRTVALVRVQNIATGDHTFTVRDFRAPLKGGARVLVAERDIVAGDATVASLYDGGSIDVTREGFPHG